MCGESGLIRERLQGREQSCSQLLEGGAGNHATRCSACASAIACIAAFLRTRRHERNVNCALQPALLYDIAKFALCGHQAWRKVYTIRERVASFGQCRMRWLRLGIPNLLFLRRRMPRPIKQVWAGDD